MVTLFITSVLILGLAAIAIYFWQKAATTETIALPPSTPPRGLFSEIQATDEIAEAAATDHTGIIERANSGDLTALSESKDQLIYSDVLDVFVSQAFSESKLLSLTSYIAKQNLPVNSSLAEAMIRSWQVTPNRQTTAKMLHFAALSDDADLYEKAVDLALSFWRESKLPDLTATELLSLFNGEFWILSSGVRNSGNGFVLKRTLSSARRELEGTTNNRSNIN
jgi:hypothetical protein